MSKVKYLNAFRQSHDPVQADSQQGNDGFFAGIKNNTYICLNNKSMIDNARII